MSSSFIESALAQAGAISSTELFARVQEQILNPIITIMFGVALFTFLLGLVESIRDAASEEGRSRGRQHMLWGVIGLAIMVSAFGLVNLICETINCAP